MPTDHADPLRLLFEPPAVAFIGASSDPYKLGGRPIRFLKTLGYGGRILPVNPGADTIQGLPAYATLDEVPGEVPHAVVVVPAARCEAALEACIRKGVRVVQVFSAGFAEVGGEGVAMQARLLARAREAGIRMLGPNCLGVVSPANQFYATFSTALEALVPQPGGVALATQSGAFGSCAYATAIQRGIGLSRVVATGNEADIDVADCIAWLAQDERTRVICAALEGCQDGDRLRHALRLAARAGKPVVVMKVGASEVGSAAAATHTGSLAGNDRIFDTVFRECGALRAHSIEAMLDIAALATTNPLPVNDRAGIVTLSGGVGVLMADEAEKQGLLLPPMPEAAAVTLRQLAPFATIGNPMDTTAQISQVKDGMSNVYGTVLDHTDWGTVFLYLAQKAAEPKAFASFRVLLQHWRARHPSRCLVLVGPSDEGVRHQLEGDGFAVFTDPSRAVQAVGAAVALRRRMAIATAAAAVKTSTGRVPDAGSGQIAASDQAARGHGAAAPSSRTLAEDEAKQWLARAGLPVPAEYRCADADAAVAAAERLGYPVVAKIVSADIPHKTEMGGVLLNLRDAAAVRQAHDTLRARARQHRPDARIDGVLIAPMAGDGIDVILGIQCDPVFGPVLMYGLGGVAVELYQDVAFASAPLDEAQARDLIDRVKGSALLRGWRGAPPMDIAALVDAMVKLSTLAHAQADHIAAIDINPLRVQASGAWCLDAVVQLRG